MFSLTFATRIAATQPINADLIEVSSVQLPGDAEALLVLGRLKLFVL